jgi:hypothetical protein
VVAGIHAIPASDLPASSSRPARLRTCKPHSIDLPAARTASDHSAVSSLEACTTPARRASLCLDRPADEGRHPTTLNTSGSSRTSPSHSAKSTPISSAGVELPKTMGCNPIQLPHVEQNLFAQIKTQLVSDMLCMVWFRRQLEPGQHLATSA